MRTVVCKKIITDGDSKVILIVDHEDHKVGLEVTSGPAISFNEFVSIMVHDKDVIKEMEWAHTNYKRVYPVAVKVRVGSSGCTDYTLIRSVSPDPYSLVWKTKALYHVCYELHLSMYDKLNAGFEDCFSGDLVDLLSWILEEKSEGIPISSKGFRSHIWKKQFKYVKYHGVNRENIHDINSMYDYRYCDIHTYRR